MTRILVGSILVFLFTVSFALGQTSIKCPQGSTLEHRKDKGKAVQSCVKKVDQCPENDLVDVLPSSYDPQGGCRIPHGPTHYIYADGGQLIMNYEEGVFQGKSKVLNPMKALILEENYSQGLRDGTQKSFYPKGSKKTVENFVAGVKHGEQLAWHENGQLEKRSFYDQGSPKGIWTSWYPNGNKKFEVASGKFGWEGLYREWYSTGRLHLAAQYLNGQLEGTYTMYFSNGKKQSERRYSQGVLEGVFEEWGPKGNKLCASLYREGKFHEWVQKPKEDSSESKEQSERELASQSLRADFDGNGYLDQVKYLENPKRSQVLLRSKDKIISEIILSEPMVELYSLRGREGQFGEPATPRDGLVVWGKGKETKVYLYNFDSEKFEMTTYMSDLDI